jgi:hypothetical protein
MTSDRGYGPCLRCGDVGKLFPGRLEGRPVYCLGCAGIKRPFAIGARTEHKQSTDVLLARGVNVGKYRKRGGVTRDE